MIVKSVGAVSLAKVFGALYVILGFGFGCLFALFSVLGGSMSESEVGPVGGAIFGLGAIVIAPVAYGIIGFLGTLFMALMFNLVAGLVGGVEIHIDQHTATSQPSQGA